MILASLVASMVLAPEAAADDTAPPPRLAATMQCERAGEPGRVRCSIEATAREGKAIAWADAVIVSLPDFATALKGRIGPDDATARDPAAYRWAFGLVARKGGQGEARARVRAVVCDAGSPARCAPAAVDVHTIVTVGG